MENKDQNNNLQEPQEIDYKAEYERMTAEKDRKEVLTNLEKVLSEKGYSLNAEELSKNTEGVNNDTLKEATKLINNLVKTSPYTYVPGNGATSDKKDRITFEDAINK
ncbi:hypothetical protein GCM10008916_25390 [Clostridium nitritogenes]|uniref:Uncharacterized protein n=1 Tax=Clostridium nitritogenes TaxID=83340 RepID=A0ABN1LTQ9_9CLOT